jgi:hypothetical protein
LRLLAAQITEGQRPDVVVVPLGMLGRGSVAADVAVRERKTEALIRTLSLAGVADEFSLSTLAERRPLYVELDPRWDKSIATHLTISGVLLAFAPQPLGVSDRKASFAASTETLGRLFQSVAPDAPADPESLALVMSIVKSDNLAFFRVGEVPTALDAISFARRTAGARVLDSSSPEVTIADAQARVREATPVVTSHPAAHLQRPATRAPRRQRPKHPPR